MANSNDIDLVIVGAGAAGLGAARRALDLGLTVRVLEARDRMGGRAWTEANSFGFPIDIGCHWLHSAEENPWVKIAKELDFPVSRMKPTFRGWNGQRWLSKDEDREAEAAISAYFNSISEAGLAGHDVAVAEVTPRDGPWTHLCDAVLSWDTSVDAEQASTLDLARFRRTEEDWSQKDGLGALVARYGAGLPVTLDAPVTDIRWTNRWTNREVVAETPKGTVKASAAIVTVPPSLLAAGIPQFYPPLPADFMQACADLPLGSCEKAFLGIDLGLLDFEPDTYAVLGSKTRRMASVQIHPFGLPLATVYFGGAYAHDVAAAGSNAIIAAAVDELAQVFGSAALRTVTHAVATGWDADPWSRGAYSAALPGRACARNKLQDPLGERVFFAGEACSIESWATVHGALQSGWAAAERAAAVLNSRG